MNRTAFFYWVRGGPVALWCLCCFVFGDVGDSTAEETKLVRTHLYAQFVGANVCQLKAPGQMYPQGSEFAFVKSCRFDESSDSWKRVEPTHTYASKIDVNTRQVYSRETDQVLLDLGDEIGLYWVEWRESEGLADTLAYCGPVLCQDVMIGPMRKSESIAACVPRKSSALARYVPDPKLFCH